MRKCRCWCGQVIIQLFSRLTRVSTYLLLESVVDVFFNVEVRIVNVGDNAGITLWSVQFSVFLLSFGNKLLLSSPFLLESLLLGLAGQGSVVEESVEDTGTEEGPLQDLHYAVWEYFQTTTTIYFVFELTLRVGDAAEDIITLCICVFGGSVWWCENIVGRIRSPNSRRAQVYAGRPDVCRLSDSDVHLLAVSITGVK